MWIEGDPTPHIIALFFEICYTKKSAHRPPRTAAVYTDSRSSMVNHMGPIRLLYAQFGFIVLKFRNFWNLLYLKFEKIQRKSGTHLRYRYRSIGKKDRPTVNQKVGPDQYHNSNRTDPGVSVPHISRDIQQSSRIHCLYPRSADGGARYSSRELSRKLLVLVEQLSDIDMVTPRAWPRRVHCTPHLCSSPADPRGDAGVYAVRMLISADMTSKFQNKWPDLPENHRGSHRWKKEPMESWQSFRSGELHFDADWINNQQPTKYSLSSPHYFNEFLILTQIQLLARQRISR